MGRESHRWGWGAARVGDAAAGEGDAAGVFREVGRGALDLERGLRMRERTREICIAHIEKG